MQVNQHKIKAIFDTGAAFTCVSEGLARALGWEIVEDIRGGTVSGIEGTRKALVGRIIRPTIAFSKEFEVEVSHIVVVPSQEYLFLLGNDIFRSHEAFAFLQLRAAGPTPWIEIWDAHRKRLVTIPCERGPSSLREP